MPPTADSFTSATSIVRAPSEHTAPAGRPTPRSGSYRSRVAEGWDILGNANGGYLLSAVARACAAELDRPDPVSITGHYLSPAAPGPTSIEVDVQREGRRFSVAAARMFDADGTMLLSTLGSFSDLSVTTGPEMVEAAPPKLPPVEECVGADPAALSAPDEGSTWPNFMDKVDLRLHPQDAAFGQGRPSGTARVRGWFRFADGADTDTLGLLCALDAFPPTVLNSDLPAGWVPTLEFTAHVRRRPAPGWLACEFTTRVISSGFLEEDGLVWDGDGHLVAQSRQLALVPRG